MAIEIKYRQKRQPVLSILLPVFKSGQIDRIQFFNNRNTSMVCLASFTS